MSDKRTAEEGRFAGLALAEEELVARVAWCYYHDGLTQNDIGERLGLPRLKISRLLEKGRQSGVIRVQINSRYEGCLALETELQQRFGLKLVRVMPALNTPPMNVRLGIDAKSWSATVWAKNLTDKQYNAEWSPGPMFFPNPGYTNNFVFKAMPRRWGVDLNYRF